MFSPITELGIYFNDQCKKLNDYFKVSALQRGGRGVTENQSLIVRSFFESINNLTDRISHLDTSLTVLFEIDQAICGSYGAKVFIEYSESPIRKLLRDLIAFWYRYELLSKLERVNSEFFEVNGIRNYYEEWLKTERVGLDITEYERILQNVVVLLENSENLDTPTRVLVFKIFGDILITLGVSREDVDKTLQKYIYDIKDRLNPPLTAFSEVLLNLHVFHNLGYDFNTLKSIDFNDLVKAVRYWSSLSDFSDHLFKSWNIYWENDFYSKLTEVEENQLANDKTSLSTILKQNKKRSGIGHSYLEFIEYKKNNPGLGNIFKPIPLFMFGNSGVGKSSYLMSFAYDVQMKISKGAQLNNVITIGREFQSFYQSNNDNWQRNQISPTNNYNNYSFWEDLNNLSFIISDYGGAGSQPDQWDPKLQELFIKARSLVFFIDYNDFTNPVNLRRQASIFDAFLQYWVQSNIGVYNIPIALILTKCDLFFNENLNVIQRPYLVPDNLNPLAIDGNFPDRLTDFTRIQLNNPYMRLRDCIFSDKMNNLHPNLQDLTESILDNFGQFFNRILDITHNYQIFLTASIAPKDKNDTLFPFGSKEPLQWISKVLTNIYNQETKIIILDEEKQIEQEIFKMTEDIKRMYMLCEQIKTADDKIRDIRESTSKWVQLTSKRVLEEAENQKSKDETSITKMLMIYNENFDSVNLKGIIKRIELRLNELETIFNDLKNKKKNLEINSYEK